MNNLLGSFVSSGLYQKNEDGTEYIPVAFEQQLNQRNSVLEKLIHISNQGFIGLDSGTTTNAEKKESFENEKNEREKLLFRKKMIFWIFFLFFFFIFLKIYFGSI